MNKHKELNKLKGKILALVDIIKDRGLCGYPDSEDLDASLDALERIKELCE